MWMGDQIRNDLINWPKHVHKLPRSGRGAGCAKPCGYNTCAMHSEFSSDVDAPDVGLILESISQLLMYVNTEAIWAKPCSSGSNQVWTQPWGSFFTEECSDLHPQVIVNSTKKIFPLLHHRGWNNITWGAHCINEILIHAGDILNILHFCPSASLFLGQHPQESSRSM